MCVAVGDLYLVELRFVCWIELFVTCYIGVIYFASTYYIYTYIELNC